MAPIDHPYIIRCLRHVVIVAVLSGTPSVSGELLPVNIVLGLGDDPNGSMLEIDSRDHFGIVARKFGANADQIEVVLASTGGVVCPTPHGAVKYIVGTGFLVGDRRQIATARHVVANAIKSEGESVLDRGCFFRLPETDRPIMFDRSVYDGSATADIRNDGVLIGALASPASADPIPILSEQPMRFMPVLSYMAYQASMTRPVPTGAPIGGIGYVRDLKSFGFNTDLDMSTGGSGGPVLAFHDDGTGPQLYIVGMTLETGLEETDGAEYSTEGPRSQRSGAYMLYMDQFTDDRQAP